MFSLLILFFLFARAFLWENGIKKRRRRDYDEFRPHSALWSLAIASARKRDWMPSVRCLGKALPIRSLRF